jgi:ATP-binding cassette subfamily B protein
MNAVFQDAAPAAAVEALSGGLEPGESIRFSVRSDLDVDCRFGQSWVVATGRRVAVLDSERVIKQFPFAEISEVRVDELFGGGRLMVSTAGGDRHLVYYTRTLVPEFSVLCRILSDLREGRDPVLPSEHQHAYCRRCGSPLPERGGSCPLCVPRLQVLRRLLGLVRPYRGRAAVLVAMTFIGVAAQMGPPYITKMIVDDVITRGHLGRLPLWIALMVGCSTAYMGSRLIGGTLTAWFGARVVADLRSRLHGVIQRVRMNFFSGRESGEVISRIMHDTGELQHFLIDGVPYFLVRMLSFVAIAVVLATIDLPMALMVFLPVPLLILGGGWFWGRLIPMFHKYSSRVGTMHSILGESVHGIKAVKAFSGEAMRNRLFDRANEQYFQIGCNVESVFVGFFEVMFWVMSAGVAAVWFMAATRIVQGGGAPGALTLGDLLAFVGYIWLFYGPLQWFTTMLNWMSHAFSSAERIFAVLDAREEVYDAPDAVDLPRARGAVSFRDVRFSYERGREVVKGVTFDVAPGEMIGLVGKSGAGKSTLINLICRFYDIDSGVITLDGHPLQKLRLQQLRRQIGMVLQEPFLFNATILENISYGVADVTFAEVVEAARAANAHDFILDKEDGYDTVIGERGVALSGGEKQRLAIARAILHDPAILILDEATSSVDSETEKMIQEAIARLVRGRTTIAIAHRLSTLRNAHRLMVIDDGKVAEIGTHDELIAKDGIYARLVRIQTDLSRLRGMAWQE